MNNIRADHGKPSLTVYTSMYQVVTFFTALLLISGLLSGLLVGLLAATGNTRTVLAAGFQLRLSPEETALATRLALQTSAPGPDKTPRVQAALPVQTLLVDTQERKQPSHAHERLVEVFLYDYSREQTLYRLVDLSRSQVILSRILATHHLPLSASERQFALQQVRNDATLWSSIRNEQRLADASTSGNAAGASLAILEVLDAKVSILEPLSADASCATTRCAQLTFTTARRVSLPVEPVVVLATGEILLPEQ